MGIYLDRCISTDTGLSQRGTGVFQRGISLCLRAVPKANQALCLAEPSSSASRVTS